MNTRISKLLRQRAYELSSKENKMEGKKTRKNITTTVGGKIRSFLHDFITIRYDKNSPIRIYRELKKRWMKIPKDKRDSKLINKLGAKW